MTTPSSGEPPEQQFTVGHSVENFFANALRHTKGRGAGTPFVLEPWQREFVREFYRTDKHGKRVYRLGILGIPRGNGKDLDLLTPTATPDGWTTMGELQIGDHVFGPDGAPTKVIAATPPLLDRECYELEFSNGEKIVAGADHIWLTEEANRNNVPTLKRTWEIAETLIREMPRQGRMQTGYRHRVRLGEPLQLSDAKLPIDPYVLGAWLADGQSASGSITPGDRWIVEKIETLGYSVTEHKTHAGTSKASFGILGLQTQLRALGVLGDKRIPMLYQRASAAQRMELLNGLLDGDGYCSKGQGQVEIVSVLPDLADDIFELVRGLGFKVTMKEKRAQLDGRDMGPCWRITFTPDRPVFTLPRKLARQKVATARVKYVQIVGCEKVKTRPTRCITVERPDGMFLSGRGLIPTHNSPLAAGFGLYEVTTRTDSPDVFCVSGSKEQAAVVHGFAREFVEVGPLKNAMKANKKAIVFPRTNGTMKILSAAGSLQHGLSVSAVIGDELHGFTTANQVETWTAMWTAMHKRDNSFALAITTAGFDKNTLLGKMYDQALEMGGKEDRMNGCLRIRRDIENGVLFWWYGVPERLEHDWENEEHWKAVNPASWLRTDELHQQLNAPGFDELDFKRLHLNMWTRSRETWLPGGTWTACGVDPLQIPDDAPVYVGVDVGWYHDSTAVSWAYRDPKTEKIVVRAKVWTTMEEQLGEFVPGGRMNLELVEEFILEYLKPKYRIREVAFDPAFFGRSASILDRKGVRVLELAPQSAPVTEGWQHFYQAVCETRISHDPLHEGGTVLTAHVDAAAVEQTMRGPRVRKAKATSRIDALAAVVLAFARCEVNTRKKNGPNVFFFDMDS